jgi:hypothetical protein
MMNVQKGITVKTKYVFNVINNYVKIVPIYLLIVHLANQNSFYRRIK